MHRCLLTYSTLDIWRNFWHDLLRQSQLSVAIWLVPRTMTDPFQRNLTLIWVSFVITGTVHCAATYSISQDPWATGKLFLFFLVQPIGITMPHFLGKLRQQPGLFQFRIPSAIKWLANLAYVLVWAHLTVPWLLDEPALLDLLANIPIPGSLTKLLCKYLIN